MHQYQQMEMAKQRIDSMQREAEARRQRNAARRNRARRRWPFGRRRRALVRRLEGSPLGMTVIDPSAGTMHHDGERFDRAA